ncbi:MAG: hypothetical protein EA401_07235 [Planctomycetota bacterium]|nr:MAG: hypothetical protein EA401_07235 [Planctomycetota bacterium]
MADLWSQYIIDGASLAVSLSNGGWIRGTVIASDRQWLLLDSNDGQLAIHIAHIQAISLQGSLPASLTAGKNSMRAGRSLNTKSDKPYPAHQFAGHDLRKAIDALFDGADNAALQALLGITRQDASHLRKAFACMRGDVEPADLPAAALQWVEPLQAAARGE